MSVRVLRRGERVSPLHLPPTAVQSAHLPLVGQFHHRAGAVYTRRSLRLLLLGQEET